MPQASNPLDGVRVAKPCPADWEGMAGDERARFCNLCNLNVYNLSGMSRREAESLITSTEGRLCVRFYRRADGTILTRDCPVGLRALKRRVRRIANAFVSAALGFFSGVGLERTLVQPRHTVGAIAVGNYQSDSLKVPTPSDAPGKMMGVMLRPDEAGHTIGKLKVHSERSHFKRERVVSRRKPVRK